MCSHSDAERVLTSSLLSVLQAGCLAWDYVCSETGVGGWGGAVCGWIFPQKRPEARIQG